MTTTNCKSCTELFERKYVNQLYCCVNCRQYKFKRICERCNNSYLSDKSTSRFCSGSCRSIKLNLHQFAHTKSGRSRSKIEIWLETQLLSKFQNLTFVFNDKQTINMELDIYLPELKLAFELNGVFHYLPIYGEGTLTKIQNRDQVRSLKCYDNGIELVTINLGNNAFTVKKSNDILEIISNFIFKNIKRIKVV